MSGRLSKAHRNFRLNPSHLRFRRRVLPHLPIRRRPQSPRPKLSEVQLQAKLELPRVERRAGGEPARMGRRGHAHLLQILSVVWAGGQ